MRRPAVTVSAPLALLYAAAAARNSAICLSLLMGDTIHSDSNPRSPHSWHSLSSAHSASSPPTAARPCLALLLPLRSPPCPSSSVSM